MANEQTELQKLFRGNEASFTPPTEQVVSPENEEIPEDLKNRHIRRLEARLQAEKEAAIAREARIEALSEAQKFRKETGADDELDSMVARIYGTDKPENAAATELLQKALKGYSDRAKEEAISTLREEFRAQQQEEAKETQTVQNYIEQIEDQYGIDFSSTQAGREKQQEFRDLWFRLSPKDANGEVKEYADPFEVYEIFSQRQPVNRAQSVAARGMTRSAPTETSASEDATVKYLKEHGILEPF